MADPVMEAAEIASLLPYRHPFQLVDRVLELEPGKRILALKNVTHNEPHFQGHFPGLPIMPGVLIIECLAQSCALLCLKSFDYGEVENKRMVLAGVTRARFRRRVIPGDALTLEATLLRRRGDMAQLACKATVGGEAACDAELLATAQQV